MKSNTPGLDSISFNIIKGLNEENIKIICDKFNECLQQGNIPNDWKYGWVKLLPKRDVQQLNDIRPITILPIFYRILFNIIAFRLRIWAEKNINIRQQAFISKRNTMNHGLVIAALAMKYKKDFLLINLDIEGAYDSVERPLIEMALKHCKFPQQLIDFILNSYDNHTLQLELGLKLSRPFKKTRGIPQGCPLAPLVYDCITQLIIDKCIEHWDLTKNPDTLDINNIGLLAFADDMNLVSDSTCDYNQRLRELNRWLKKLGLKINPNKSIATCLPKKHNFKPKIGKKNIPIESNMRVLGHYPWHDPLCNKDIEKRIAKFKLSLKYFPIRRLEMIHIRKVIHAKCISLFTHYLRTNFIPPKYVKVINIAIRQAIRKRARLDMRSSTHHFHRSLEKGGLNVPRIEDFCEKLNMKTLLYLANCKNPLVRAAYQFGTGNANTTKKNIFKELNTVLEKYNFTLHKCKGNERLQIPQLSGKHFEIYTDGSKSDNAVGLGFTIKDDQNETHNFSYKISDEYSNNIAEISAILLSMKMLPRQSTANIHSDSKIAIDFLSNKKYIGMFECFQNEFQAIKKNQKLQIKLNKVKGHEDPGNIVADQLAKKGSISSNFLHVIDLLTNKQLVFTIQDNLLVLDYKKIMSEQQADDIEKTAENKSTITITEGWHSISLKYIKGNHSPETKLAIWRNLINTHIVQTKTTFCEQCDRVTDLGHYIYCCPRLEEARLYFYAKFYQLTGISAKLTDFPSSHFDPNRNVFCIHHNGFMIEDTVEENTIDHPTIVKNWSEIQVLLALLAGKAHT